MKKLIIDIKDGYAIAAASGDSGQDFIKIDFDEIDFTAEPDGSSPPGLFDFSSGHLTDFYNQADQIVLAVPIRFSLVKSIAISLAAVKKYGDDFLQWEARQQIPEELGKFITGLKKIGESFDGKFGKYLFYASPEDFIEVLMNFVAPDSKENLVLDSEAVGLFNALNLAADKSGFSAAISLEHDGASVVLSRDGEFLAGRFISGENPNLSDEIMFYIMGHAPDDTKPRVLICGDITQIRHFGSINWAEELKIPNSLDLVDKTGQGHPGAFVAAAGLLINV